MLHRPYIESMIPLLVLLVLALHGCVEGKAERPAPTGQLVTSDDLVALRARAARLRAIADQFDQEAATFRHEIPGGQPVLQRKAVAADSLRERAAVLESEAQRLEQQRAAGGPKSMPAGQAINARAEHRHLAVELRQLAAAYRQEAAQFARQAPLDTEAISEKQQQADRLEVLADEAESKAPKKSKPSLTGWCRSNGLFRSLSFLPVPDVST